jgi:two-component system response regulator NreC
LSESLSAIERKGQAAVSKLRIVVADDHQMFREGLKGLINAEADMEIVGEAGTGQTALRLAQELKPDAVILDISMPELNGLEVAGRLKQALPEVKILVLTRHTDDSYLKQSLQAGVNGYILKNSAASELIHAIRHTMAGHTFIDPAMTQRFVQTAVGPRPATGPEAQKSLTHREEEVLRETAKGYANKEIAARLSISVKTVETHRANAMQKMGMAGRIDIVRYARLQGWLDDL